LGAGELALTGLGIETVGKGSLQGIKSPLKSIQTDSEGGLYLFKWNK
jgi:hypothetical protein